MDEIQENNQKYRLKDKRNSALSSSNLIYWFWSNFFRKYLFLLVIGVIFMTVEGGMLGLLSYSIKAMFDEVFIPENQGALILVGLVIFSIFVLRAFSGFIQRLIVAWVSQGVEKSLQENLLRKLMHLDMEFFNKTSPGMLIERMRVDTRAVTSTAGTIFMTLIRDGISLASLITVALYVDWIWTLIAFVGAPLIIIPVFFLQKWIRKISIENRNLEGKLSFSLDEIFHGISILKLYSLESYRMNLFKGLLRKVKRIRFKMEGGVALTPALIDLIAGFGFLGVMIFGGGQILSGQKTIGDFMAFFTAMALIFEPMRRLSNVAGNLQVMLASAAKIFSYFQEENAFQSLEEDQIELGKTDFSGQIIFENVSFSIGDTLILDDVNFSVPSSSIVALVGKSGSGKTTILKLLSGLIVPTKGRIFIDGNDIGIIPFAELRKHMAIVMQDIQLFDETIYENIRIGKLNATENQIRNACDLAFVSEFTDKLPNKLDTRVGPRGTKLSGGQRQRINIARALVRNASILLLDEPTASLDSKSEKLVHQAFIKAIAGRTTLIVSHRLSTIKNAKKVLVLDKGKVVQQGSHDELIRQKGLYLDLHQLQLLGDE